MVVCKFFQEGYCRYGQNCRFEHIYGSKYSYHGNASPQPQMLNQQPAAGVTDEQLVKQVTSDVQSALKGHQWLLSCYAPFKEKPNFPGILDLSPEEARLFIYEAQANNMVETAVAYMNNLFKEAQSQYNQLLTPGPNIVQVLRSLYAGEAAQSPFSNQSQQMPNAFASNTNASSLFRSAVLTTTPFSQNTQSVFNQAQGNNVFGQTDTAKSIFSQATQNVFGSQTTQSSMFGSQGDMAKSVFGQATQDQAKSVFAQAQDPAKSIFAQSNNSFGTAPSNAFNAAQISKSPFEQPSPFAQSSSGSNIFQRNETPSNIFGQAAKTFEQPVVADDSTIYSNMNDISAEDLEAFKCDNFKLGFVPDMPPPYALCF